MDFQGGKTIVGFQGMDTVRIGPFNVKLQTFGYVIKQGFQLKTLQFLINSENELTKICLFLSIKYAHSNVLESKIL